MPSGKASRLTDIAASLPLEGPTEQDKKTVRRARKDKTSEQPKKEAALLKPVAAKEAVREVKAEMSKEAAAAKKEACAPFRIAEIKIFRTTAKSAFMCWIPMFSCTIRQASSALKSTMYIFR